MGFFDDLVPGGGGGKAKMSGLENKELSDARKANMDGRDTFHALANIYRTASRYPGGIPNNVADSWGAALGFKGQQVQDQQLFNAQANQASIGQARLLAPVSNSDLEMLKRASPNPALRFDNNKELIGAQYEKAARQYFENAFKQRWAAKNGGLNSTDKSGRAYPQALADAMARPDVAQELLAPWKRQAAAKPAPAASGAWKVIR